MLQHVGDDGGGGGDGSDDVYRGRAEPVLDSVSDLYSNDEIISVCDSGPSSSPTYTLLTTCLLATALKKMINDFGLRRPFYSKQVF